MAIPGGDILPLGTNIIVTTKVINAYTATEINNTSSDDKYWLFKMFKSLFGVKN